MKSATYAGFIDPSTGRFIKPGTGRVNFSPAQDKSNSGNGGGGGGGDGIALNLDPLLIELLKKIPATKEGWAAPQRVRWFRTFAMNVSQIYDGDADPVELEIKVAQSEG